MLVTALGKAAQRFATTLNSFHSGSMLICTAKITSGVLVTALSVGCATTGEDRDTEQTAFLDFYTAESDDGQDCISRANIDSIRIIGDRTIEFKMRGGDSFINVLPHTCPGLRPGRTISYETRQSRLCKIDTISLFDQSGVTLRPTTRCGLGRFHEIVTGDVVIEDDE